MSLNDVIKIIIDAILEALKPKPTPTPIPIPSPTTPILQLLQLHNNYRQQLGLNPLVLNQALNNAAQKHSNWMLQNNNMNHFEGGIGPGDRIKAEGYNWRAYGENIANGYSTAQAVFQGWLNSSGHRANIVNPTFKDVGLGVAGKYWTTDFATTSGSASMTLPGGIKGE